MPSMFDFPTSQELRQIEQELLPRFTDTRDILQFFPIETADAPMLAWEQRDDYFGLQQLRGYNNPAFRVQMIDHKSYLMHPGVYGDFIPIDEAQLTMRRQVGTYATPINVNDLVRENQELLLERRLDRIESILWTLVSTGTFSVANSVGGISYGDSFPIRQYTAPVSWATWATAKPLMDMRQAQLASRGYSVDFGRTARAFVNRTTFNNLISNTNAVDLYGRRVAGLATVNNINDVNQILMGEDLPPLTIYEKGYKDNQGKFTLFVPDNKVVIIGKRPGNVAIGNYRMTRNANNPNMEPGAYTFVSDNSGRDVPRTLQVNDGHNGGPVIYYPSAILIINV